MSWLAAALRSMPDLQPLWLTFRLAGLTTCILLVIGIPLAYWLAYTPNRFKPVLETLVSMPLVLPPSVLGFYLLLAFSPQNAFGHWLEIALGWKLVFSFAGLVLGSVIFSLPFMVHPLQSGLQNLPMSLIEASRTLGKSDLYSLFRVLLPNCRSALLSGIVLSFAHTVGEFGVVLMIGGNIPGITRTLSVCIYDDVQALNYDSASRTAIVLVLFSLSVLSVTHILSHRTWPK